MNLLKFYKDCMSTGRLPNSGLCACFGESRERDIFKRYFEPTFSDIKRLKAEGLSRLFWGYGGNIFDNSDEKRCCFTPLRQTLVLLLNEIMKDLKKEKFT